MLMKARHLCSILFVFSLLSFSACYYEQFNPPQMYRAYAGCASLNGFIYAIGGISSTGETLSSVEKYEIATDTWSYAAPLPYPISSCPAIALDGKIYVVGDNRRNILSYSSHTDSWNITCDGESQYITGCGVAAVGGKIYFIGGFSHQQGEGSLFSSYDPINNLWHTLPRISSITFGVNFQTAVVGRNIWVMGGNNHQGYSSYTVGSVWIYDTYANSWTQGPGIDLREGGFAFVMHNTIYLDGGFTTSRDGNIYRAPAAVTSSEYFDLDQNYWSRVSEYYSPSYGSAAVFNDAVFVLARNVTTGTYYEFTRFFPPTRTVSPSTSHSIFSPSPSPSRTSTPSTTPSQTTGRTRSTTRSVSAVPQSSTSSPTFSLTYTPSSTLLQKSSSKTISIDMTSQSSTCNLTLSQSSASSFTSSRSSYTTTRSLDVVSQTTTCSFSPSWTISRSNSGIQTLQKSYSRPVRISTPEYIEETSSSFENDESALWPIIIAFVIGCVICTIIFGFIIAVIILVFVIFSKYTASRNYSNLNPITKVQLEEVEMSELVSTNKSF